MSSRGRSAERLAAAIADDQTIDWGRVGDDAVVQQLRTISAIASAASAPREALPIEVLSRTRLHGVQAGIVAVATVRVMIGAACFAAMVVSEFRWPRGAVPLYALIVAA